MAFEAYNKVLISHISSQYFIIKFNWAVQDINAYKNYNIQSVKQNVRPRPSIKQNLLLNLRFYKMKETQLYY